MKPMRLFPTSLSWLLGACLALGAGSLSTQDALAAPPVAHAQLAATADPALRSAAADQNLRKTALQHFKKSAWKEAGDAYALLVKAHPQEGKLWHQYGYVLHSLGQYDAAIKAWETQRSVGYLLGNADHNIACAYAKKGDSSRALSSLASAISTGEVSIKQLREDEDLKNLRSDRKYKDLEAGLARVTQDWEKANEALKAEKWAEGVKLMSSVTAGVPQDGEAWHKLAYAQIGARDLKGAEKSLEKQLQLKHYEGLGYYNLACLLALQGDAKGSVQNLRTAIDKGFHKFEYLEKDDDLKAIRGSAEFKALQAEISERHALMEKAEKATEAKDWDAALEPLEALVAAHPNHDKLASKLAYARIMAGDYEAAIAQYSSMARAGVMVDKALYNIACAYAQTGKIDQSFAYLGLAIEAGFYDEAHLRADSDLTNLRSDARFEAYAGWAKEQAALCGSCDLKKKQACGECDSKDCSGCKVKHDGEKKHDK